MRTTLDRQTPPPATAPPQLDDGTGGSHTPPPAPRLRGPWCRRDAVVAVVVATIGITGVVWCWIRASDDVIWRDQLDEVRVGALCSTIFVLACVGWVLVGMRRVRAQIGRLRADRARIYGTALDGLVPDATAGVELAGTLVTAKSMTRVHRSDCLLMRGKTPVVVTGHQVDTYPRCGVCRG